MGNTQTRYSTRYPKNCVTNEHKAELEFYQESPQGILYIVKKVVHDDMIKSFGLSDIGGSEVGVLLCFLETTTPGVCKLSKLTSLNYISHGIVDSANAMYEKINQAREEYINDIIKELKKIFKEGEENFNFNH